MSGKKEEKDKERRVRTGAHQPRHSGRPNLIINKMKREKEAKAQDVHTIMAESSRMLCRALMLENSVMVHAGRGV
jgi:hypothetical protein